MVAGFVQEARSSTHQVVGIHSGHRLRFSLLHRGWKIEVAANPLPIVFDVIARHIITRHSLHAPNYMHSWLRFDDKSFDSIFSVDGSGEVTKDVLDSSFRQRIIELAPDRIRFAKGELQLTKTYNYYYAEADNIRTAIELAVALVTQADEVCKDLERPVLKSGAHPFRPEAEGAMLWSDKLERDFEIAGTLARIEKRDRLVRFSRITEVTVVLLSLLLVLSAALLRAAEL